MCFHASDPSWAPAWPSSWPGVPVRLVDCVSGLVCHQLGVTNKHLVHVSQTQIQQVLLLGHHAVPEVQDRPHFLLRPAPGSLQPQVPRLVCVCELANVRDLQDRAPFARQSSFDTFPCEVLMSSREQQCQNTQSNRSSHHTI